MSSESTWPSGISDDELGNLLDRLDELIEDIDFSDAVRDTTVPWVACLLQHVPDEERQRNRCLFGSYSGILLRAFKWAEGTTPLDRALKPSFRYGVAAVVLAVASTHVLDLGLAA